MSSNDKWHGIDKGDLFRIGGEPFGVAIIAHGLGLTTARSVGLAALVVILQFSMSIAVALARGKLAPIFEAARRSVLWGGEPPKPTKVRRIGRVRAGRSAR